jgi:hypothetical protein
VLAEVGLFFYQCSKHLPQWLLCDHGKRTLDSGILILSYRSYVVFLLSVFLKLHQVLTEPLLNCSVFLFSLADDCCPHSGFLILPPLGCFLLHIS